jgi:NADH-quinone oxidoreductase subunit N
MSFDLNQLTQILPLLMTVIFGLFLPLIAPVLPADKKGFYMGWISFVALVLTAGVAVAQLVAGPSGEPIFHGHFAMDSYALFFTLLFLACGAITTLVTTYYLPREQMGHEEFYALMFFSIAGMIVLAGGTNLVTLFLGVEIMSMAIYALAGFRRWSLKSNEAVLKYFFLGSFSSGILLFGIAMVYGATGSLELGAISQWLGTAGQPMFPLFVLGMAMTLVGLGFKVAAAPFHSWTPDVYEGAPAPVTGFMATAVKAASFAFFLRVLQTGFMPAKAEWVQVLAALAVITMFTGNLLAFVQPNIKRMLAYSSIAHTGYMLMGLVALSPSAENTAGTAILYYLVAYSLTNLGLFACISFLSKQGEKLVNIEDYAGVAQKYPWIALAIMVCMFSLIGLPPTAGFFGKYYLFTAVVQQGFAWLAIIGIINSILSVYYYLRVVVTMYMKEPKTDWAGVSGLGLTRIAATICVVAVLWAGIGSFNLLAVFPGAEPLLSAARSSVGSLF